MKPMGTSEPHHCGSTCAEALAHVTVQHVWWLLMWWLHPWWLLTHKAVIRAHLLQVNHPEANKRLVERAADQLVLLFHHGYVSNLCVYVCVRAHKVAEGSVYRLPAAMIGGEKGSCPSKHAWLDNRHFIRWTAHHVRGHGHTYCSVGGNSEILQVQVHVHTLRSSTHPHRACHLRTSRHNQMLNTCDLKQENTPPPPPWDNLHLCVLHAHQLRTPLTTGRPRCHAAGAAGAPTARPASHPAFNSNPVHVQFTVCIQTTLCFWPTPCAVGASTARPASYPGIKQHLQCASNPQCASKPRSAFDPRHARWGPPLPDPQAITKTSIACNHLTQCALCQMLPALPDH